MLKKPLPHQTKLEMVTLEGLVPKDHLLRKIDAVIDFSFIHDRVAGLYCADNGRPPLDPTLMFKALFVGGQGLVAVACQCLLAAAPEHQEDRPCNAPSRQPASH